MRALGLALLALAACKPSGKQPLVEVSALVRAGEADEAEVRAMAVRAIEREGQHEVRKAKGEEIGWQLTVSVELSVERGARANDAGLIPEDQVFRAAGVRMRLQALGRPPGHDTPPRFESRVVVGENQPIFGDGKVVIERAIGEAARLIGIDLRLARAPDKRLLGELDSPDAKVRAAAARVLRERPFDWVPAVIARLEGDEEDPEVIVELLGALIDRKDPRGVGPLIESARRRPPAFLGQILFGVATIGGSEAEAYLFTVASGHADPEARKNAQDALQELTRRKTVPADP